jgi:hypothetical protein
MKVAVNAGCPCFGVCFGFHAYGGYRATDAALNEALNTKRHHVSLWRWTPLDLDATRPRFEMAQGSIKCDLFLFCFQGANLPVNQAQCHSKQASTRACMKLHGLCSL